LGLEGRVRIKEKHPRRSMGPILNANVKALGMAITRRVEIEAS
jgi:hypothetical protein